MIGTDIGNSTAHVRITGQYGSSIQVHIVLVRAHLNEKLFLWHSAHTFFVRIGLHLIGRSINWKKWITKWACWHLIRIIKRKKRFVMAKNFGLTFKFSHNIDLYRADLMPPKLLYERRLRPMSRTYSPFYLLLWKTLLRLMNQVNLNSNGPAAISVRLSTTHTIKQPDHLNVFFHAVTNIILHFCESSRNGAYPFSCLLHVGRERPWLPPSCALDLQPRNSLGR